MIEWLEYMKQAVEDQASDLFFVAGGPVSEKLEGKIHPIGQQRLMPEDTRHVVTEIYKAANRDMAEFLQRGDDDFSFALSGVARFRVNAYRQRGSMAVVIRVVSFDIPDWKIIGIPEQVMALSELTEGMVLITGTAGSGKSTTLAAMINHINKNFCRHILTLEDPVEYLFDDEQSRISQRETGQGSGAFARALRSALRDERTEALRLRLEKIGMDIETPTYPPRLLSS